jgi:outer membrane receptor protein involved in Fe transport
LLIATLYFVEYSTLKLSNQKISGNVSMLRPTALAASLLLTLPFPAFAQNMPNADEAAEATQGQIIVTARRRAEDVQDVPASMSVVGGDLLTQTHTVNLSQVTQLVPALNYSSPNPRNTAFTIRGLGSSVVAISQANAHRDTDKVRSAYRRTDFRKMRADLMAAWANFIADRGAVVHSIGEAKRVAG